METQRKNNSTLLFVCISFIIFLFILAFTQFNILSKVDVSKLPESLTAEEFYALANEPNSVILDVRTSDEYNYAHIGGATNIDTSDVRTEIDKLDRNKIYLIYSKFDKQSLDIISIMKASGFTNVHFLKNGISAWKLHGKATFKEKIK